MHKTLTSVVALAGLAAAVGAAQAADAVIAGDTDEPMLLTSTQMDGVTAGAASAYVYAYNADVDFYGALRDEPEYAAAFLGMSITPKVNPFVFAQVAACNPNPC